MSIRCLHKLCIHIRTIPLHKNKQPNRWIGHLNHSNDFLIGKDGDVQSHT
jgi:hypothetical protein